MNIQVILSNSLILSYYIPGFSPLIKTFDFTLDDQQSHVNLSNFYCHLTFVKKSGYETFQNLILGEFYI